jgi:hypothetical protein
MGRGSAAIYNRHTNRDRFAGYAWRRAQTKRFAALSANIFLIDMHSSMLLPFLPLLTAQTDLSHFGMGLIVTEV